jgi:hypothetical protein
VFAALAQRAGVLNRGDRPVARERTRVMGSDVAGVKTDRRDLRLGDPHLDSPARQRRSSE